MNEKSLSSATFSKQETEFVDAASSNPDTTMRGGIPDEIDAPSVVQMQKIAVQIDASGTTIAPTGTFDVYIVDWDIEPTNGVAGLARFLDRGQEDYYDSSPLTALQVGGVQAYVMAPNTSPFPSNSAGIAGPVPPLKTIPLLFQNDIVGSTSRVVGKGMECHYTGNPLQVQGVWTQSSVPQYPKFTLQRGNAGASFAIPWTDIWTANKTALPIGDVPTALKYPGAVQRNMIDGILQNSIVNLSMATPHLPTSNARCYRADVTPTGAAHPIDLLYKPQIDPATGLVTPIQAYYETNSDITIAVATGVIGSGTLELSRTITVEKFPGPADPLISFARPSPMVNHDAIENFMNAIRAEPRFLAVKDNDFGTFARNVARGFKKAARVARVVAPALLPPAQLAMAQRVLAPVAKVEKALNKNRRRRKGVLLEQGSGQRLEQMPKQATQMLRRTQTLK
jgi:hypothetical protein